MPQLVKALPVKRSHPVDGSNQRLWSAPSWNLTLPSFGGTATAAVASSSATSKEETTSAPAGPDLSWWYCIGFFLVVGSIFACMFAIMYYLRWRKEHPDDEDERVSRGMYEPIAEDTPPKPRGGGHEEEEAGMSGVTDQVTALTQRLAIAEKRALYTQVHVDDLQRKVITLEDRVAVMERSPARRTSLDGSEGEFASGLYSFVRCKTPPLR